MALYITYQRQYCRSELTQLEHYSVNLIGELSEAREVVENLFKSREGYIQEDKYLDLLVTANRLKPDTLITFYSEVTANGESYCLEKLVLAKVPYMAEQLDQVRLYPVNIKHQIVLN